MELLQSFGTTMFWGFCDSFKGISVLVHLDKELEKKNASRLPPAHNRLYRKTSTPQGFKPQKHEQSTVVSRIFQCGLLNGAIFLLSILLFDYVILPGVKVVILSILGKDSETGVAVLYWTEMILKITFQSIWVVPLFAISKFINNLWFQDIGQSAYKYSRGRSNNKLSLSKTLADFIFSTVVETLFLLQAVVMTYLPIYGVGNILYIIHLSLLYSLYAFEYKWGEMGWEVHKRLTCIETHWSYFLGFGLVLALLTQISDNWIINGCIFSMLFPLYIISANEANPIAEPWPQFLCFSPVIFITNSLFSIIGKNKRNKGR